MKLTACLILCFTALATSPAFAQPPAAPQPASAVPEHRLTKFDLDFPGGTPRELVAAIEKAMGRRLNSIVPSEHANRQLPALKMSGVDVAQLFPALSEATVHRAYEAGRYGESQIGFRTLGQPADDSVWFFWVRDETQAPKNARFYLLTPYLDGGLTVDDITTAIRTAWRMQGEAGMPTMSFHKETKLLIAVGDRERLETIDRALEALKAPEPKVRPTANKPEEKKP